MTGEVAEEYGKVMARKAGQIYNILNHVACIARPGLRVILTISEDSEEVQCSGVINKKVGQVQQSISARRREIVRLEQTGH